MIVEEKCHVEDDALLKLAMKMKWNRVPVPLAF